MSIKTLQRSCGPHPIRQIQVTGHNPLIFSVIPEQQAYGTGNLELNPMSDDPRSKVSPEPMTGPPHKPDCGATMPEYHWITDDIFTVSGLFTADECDAYIRLAESSGFSDAPIDTAFGPQLRQDVRNNTRVMIDDPDRGEQLWQRSVDYVPKFVGDWMAIGVNERFRFYRYDIGQQFDWHFDGAFERPNGERSRLTFMIYLNDNFEGGQTSFEDTIVVPETGLALFFVHQIRHKGQPVTKGRKYVLRTDVMYRPNAG